ncbi:MAG: hypothetical protein ABL901_09235 [Hyphomicrobiaceae bacterium]
MKERRFKIDVFTPETLPMARLAEYMLEFAKVLGEPDRVHFVDVGYGSAVLRARIEEVAVPKVAQRLAEASRGQGDPAALKAIQVLDDMLANDNAVGQLLDERGAEIIAFQGRNRPKPLEYGPFREDGVLEGVVIKVGGKGASVPIWLQDRETVYKKCTARRPLARKLAKHYDGGLLRVSGTGSWMRLATGAWLMRSFEIKSFDVLDDASLADVIKRLQGVEGADWGDDPIADLTRLRTGEGLN